MPVNINCKYNNDRAWCNNKNIKRSLLGIGARCCIDYPLKNICEYRETSPQPEIKPPATKIKESRN